MKISNYELKNVIMFLKGKKTISIQQIRKHFKKDFLWVSTTFEILEKNQIISEFNGNKDRIILVPETFFESNFIFIDINHLTATP